MANNVQYKMTKLIGACNILSIKSCFDNLFILFQGRIHNLKIAKAVIAKTSGSIYRAKNIFLLFQNIFFVYIWDEWPSGFMCCVRDRMLPSQIPPGAESDLESW